MNPEEKITCLICGDDFSGQRPESLFLHAVQYHPLETLRTPKVQEFLRDLQPIMYRLGMSLARKLKGGE